MTVAGQLIASHWRDIKKLRGSFRQIRPVCRSIAASLSDYHGTSAATSLACLLASQSARQFLDSERVKSTKTNWDLAVSRVPVSTCDYAYDHERLFCMHAGGSTGTTRHSTYACSYVRAYACVRPHIHAKRRTMDFSRRSSLVLWVPLIGLVAVILQREKRTRFGPLDRITFRHVFSELTHFEFGVASARRLNPPAYSFSSACRPLADRGSKRNISHASSCRRISRVSPGIWCPILSASPVHDIRRNPRVRARSETRDIRANLTG